MQAFRAKDPEESKTLSFKFGRGLAAEDTIQSAVFQVLILSGTDPNKDSIIDGAAGLSADGKTIYQNVRNGVAGVDYALRCKVQSTLGSILVLAGKLQVRNAHEL